jgi:hypothetical protein
LDKEKEVFRGQAIAESDKETDLKKIYKDAKAVSKPVMS